MPDPHPKQVVIIDDKHPDCFAQIGTSKRISVP